MRVGVKVGSSQFVRDTPWGLMPDDNFVQMLAFQLAQLISQGDEVFLVSSGAVVSDHCFSRSKELRAAVGQPRLMARYQRYLDMYRIDAAQILLVAEDLAANRDHLSALIEEALAADVLPIINCNDAVNGQELDRLEEFADNDHLFCAVCRMLRPQAAIIVTDVGGMIGKDGNIKHRFSCTDDLRSVAKLFGLLGKEEFGTGGITSKIAVGVELHFDDIPAIIVNGAGDDYIGRALRQLSDGPIMGHEFGTVFVP